MRILYATLDWGLGHSTRSIPVIEHLVQQGFNVHLASSGLAGKVLQSVFPDMTYHELPGYRAEYSTGADLSLSLIRQLPKFLRVIAMERKETGNLHRQWDFDFIISDNRYGCYHELVPSFILCHQLTIPVQGSASLFSPLVQAWHRYFLRRFDEIWVPDWKDDFSLAGSMSDPVPGLKSRYIGWPSRFTHKVSMVGERWLFKLSGPEPQRSILEQQLLQLVKGAKRPITLIRGTSGALDLPDNIRQIPLADSKTLEGEIADSSIVFCRSGYSSIMDLIAMGKPAVLIATPGMPEQSYLAKHLSNSGMFLVQKQGEINLNAIEAWKPENLLCPRGWNKTEILNAIQQHSLLHSAALG